MKVVFTYIMITFAMSLFLVLGGVVTIDPPQTTVVEGSNLTVYSPDSIHFTSAGILVDVMDNGIKSSYLWTSFITLIMIVVVGIAINAFTGGNASVGITLGISFFVWWAIGVAGDFVSVVNKVNSTCSIQNMCSDYVYWIIYVVAGLLLVGFVYSLWDLIGGND